MTADRVGGNHDTIEDSIRRVSVRNLRISDMSTVASIPCRRHYYKPCLAGTVVGALTGLQMILVLPFNPVLALVLTVVGILLTAKLMRRWKCSACDTPLRDRHDPVCSKCNAVFRADS
jgi:hypothetical protein